MKPFPFLDRADESERLRELLDARSPGVAVLYGRRRNGKSRLLLEVLPEHRSVYYFADDREAAQQRAALAREIGRTLRGFDRTTYANWEALFARWWADAPPRSVLAIDEFPALVAADEDVPRILQKQIDRSRHRGPHLVLTGSSQRVMQGLALDRNGAFHGRANEILRIGPVPFGWLRKALNLKNDTAALEAYSVWGGVPGYWELAAQHRSLDDAIRALVLEPNGVLHDEPGVLLLDDMRETHQAASILSLVAQGCHRLTEIADGLHKPATALSRPLQRLVDFDLLRRDLPFATSIRETKRTLYHVSDPFLRFWFRFIEPNRSRLRSGQVASVGREISGEFALHISGIWDDLVRLSIAQKSYFGRTWKPAAPWWGLGIDRKPLEIDLVAESEDARTLLVAEVKWSNREEDWTKVAALLKHKVSNLPFVDGRSVAMGIWGKDVPEHLGGGVRGYGPATVASALR